MNSIDKREITTIIEQYFDGLHQGDVALLKSIFHQNAWLMSPNAWRSREQWLTDVNDRQTPVAQGRDYCFELLSIDIVKDQAMVKVRCPLFDFNYIDFLGLLKENNRWLIVSKMYTDIS